MHCPECNGLNETDAAACTTCGLLLINANVVSAPRRRAEDLATNRRRSSDLLVPCEYCGGEIAPDVIRCRHCSEIVNEDFYRERSQRFRAKINYASWVAYLFGLGALLVFRPVGILSIAAGLLLSIVYYAIPVDPPSSPKKKRPTRLGAILRNSFKLDRVALPVPVFRKRLVFVGTPLIAALVGYSANLLLLQQPVNDILSKNAAFRGMEVSAHYQYWVVPGVVVYDLKSLSVKQSPVDVHTAFLEFADRLKEKRYKRVELSFQGVTKFSIDGDAFHKLGVEYAKKNFDYVLYRFPRLFRAEAGTTPVGPEVVERDALLEFHRSWYGNDLMTTPVEQGILKK